nr:hypothetical protein GCM10020063_039370 [Dactylosporangium thailandense]
MPAESVSAATPGGRGEDAEAVETTAAPEVEREPDYRFTLANERTVLAWLRTSLALMAAGVAVVQFVPLLGRPAVREATGLGFTVLSVVVAIAAVLRWRTVQRAMRRGRPLPGSAAVWVVAAGLAAAGLGVCVMMLAGP